MRIHVEQVSIQSDVYVVRRRMAHACGYVTACKLTFELPLPLDELPLPLDELFDPPFPFPPPVNSRSKFSMSKISSDLSVVRAR